MKNVSKIIGLTAAVLLTTLSSLGADRPARAAVEHAIAVKAVSGAAEYAYDSTGWKPLTAGKVLHPGAHVRTAVDATVLIAMEEEGSLVRVGPSAHLEISKAAPATELTRTAASVQAKAKTAPKTDLNITYKIDTTRTMAALH
jgi:hypothetical protein